MRGNENRKKKVFEIFEEKGKELNSFNELMFVASAKDDEDKP